MSYLAESKGLLAGEFVRFQTHSASTKRKRVGKGVLLHAVRTRFQSFAEADRIGSRWRPPARSFGCG
jgi:hypothetical protein